MAGIKSALLEGAVERSGVAFVVGNQLYEFVAHGQLWLMPVRVKVPQLFPKMSKKVKMSLRLVPKKR